MKFVSKVFTIIAVLMAISGGLFTLNSYFAKASDLRLVSGRLETKILNDQYNAIRERMWALEARYKDMCANAPLEVKREYQKLQLELERLGRHLDIIIKEEERKIDRTSPYRIRH